MARHITGQFSNFLSVNTATAIDYPVSWAVRIKFDTGSTNGIPVSYGEAFPAWDNEYSSGGVGIGQMGVTSGQGASFFGTTLTAVTTVADQWYLLVGVWESASSRRVYLDNSTQTAVDTNTVPPHTHAQKNFTLGSFLTGPGIIHPGYGVNGHVADAAIWNTALTADDIDLLALGRPDDVKFENLQAWYKLGEDGDLTSSVGSYPPMTVYGTCPVSDDPEYPTDVTYLHLLLNIPEKSYNATDSDAPVRDRLTAWYSATPPYGDAWGQGYGNHLADTSLWKYDSIGQDNSFRIEPHILGQQIVSINAKPTSAYNGWTWCYWLRVYTFTDTTLNYYIPVVYCLSTSSIGANLHTGFVTDSPGQYGTPRQIVWLGHHSDRGITWPYTVPTDEWIHVTVIKFAYGVKPTYCRLLINGSPIGDASNGSDRDAYTQDVQYRAIGAQIYGNSSRGNYTLKDFREYDGALTDSEAYDIYQHSKGFHEQTSGLIRNDIRPVRIEEKLDYIPGEAGVYTLAGQSSSLRSARRLTSSSTSFLLSGQAAALNWAEGNKIRGNVGAFLLSGSPSVLRSTRQLVTSLGAYSSTGNSVALQLVRLLQANPGGFILTGEAAAITLKRGLLAAYGIYTLAGMNADLLYTVIHAGEGRTFYVMREDRTIRIVPDPNVKG